MAYSVKTTVLMSEDIEGKKVQLYGIWTSRTNGKIVAGQNNKTKAAQTKSHRQFWSRCWSETRVCGVSADLDCGELSEEVLGQTVHDSDSLEEECQMCPEGEDGAVRVGANSVNFNEEAFDPGRTLSGEQSPAESRSFGPANIGAWRFCFC